MPRSHRPRRRLSSEEPEPLDLERARLGARHTESRRDGLWNVQPIAPGRSEKSYICPGCGGDIAPGVSHLVAWRADGLLGEAEDVAARRHWHSHCWKIQP
ncbi:MAG TPA: hypothetical protein VNT53_09560 [Pseudolysinimonas sp.]|nr:hypothetical protein [Pseudolysinimonas sp.]